MALPAADATAEGFRRDSENRPLYPDGSAKLAGLNVVTVPALATGEVYDKSGYFLVVGDDFRITPGPGLRARLSAQLGGAADGGGVHRRVPLPARSIRKLTLTGTG